MSVTEMVVNAIVVGVVGALITYVVLEYRSVRKFWRQHYREIGVWLAMNGAEGDVTIEGWRREGRRGRRVVKAFEDARKGE